MVRKLSIEGNDAKSTVLFLTNSLVVFLVAWFGSHKKKGPDANDGQLERLRRGEGGVEEGNLRQHSRKRRLL